MLKTGDSHLSPLAASSLYSVALEEIPPGSLMFGKMLSCCVMATLTFLSAATSWLFCLPCKNFFWAALRLLVDGVGVRVRLGDGVLDLLLQNLLDDRPKDGEHDGREEIEEQLVLRLLELDLEVLDVHDDSFHLEEVLSVARVSRGHLSLEAEALSAHEDVDHPHV